MDKQALACRNCRYIVDLGDNCFICRRYPPKIYNVEGKMCSLYPIINRPNYEWCGEHVTSYSIGKAN